MHGYEMDPIQGILGSPQFTWKILGLREIPSHNTPCHLPTLEAFAFSSGACKTSFSLCGPLVSPPLLGGVQLQHEHGANMCLQ